MVGILRKKKKTNNRTSAGSSIDRFLVRAQYWLDYLEKRIATYQGKLKKLDNIIKIAAKRKDKDLIIESLKARKIVKANLSRYMGIYRNIQILINRMETAQMIKGSAEVLSEGKAILDALSSEMPPEKVIEVIEGLRTSLTKIEEAAEVASEPLMASELEEFDEEDLEAEAEKIIAEQTLPKVEKEEKEEELVSEDLEKEIREILESET